MSKRKPKPKPRPKLLTEVELELMNVVWSLGNVTVREVCEALPPERDLAYTSVATVMKILQQKGVLSERRVEGSRAHVFAPAIEKPAYEARSLDHIVDNVFAGEPSALVARLLEDERLTPEQLQQIRDALERKTR